MATIAVIGASADRAKYGNKAVRAYIDEGWEVLPVNPHEEEIEGRTVLAAADEIPLGIDRVSLYLSPTVTVSLLEALAARRPQEVWLNPGTANAEVRRRAEDLGLPVIEACSIVAIGHSPSEYS